ncbi:uncharacterized protein Triagg1_1413 [Trichoderma aggressivum f. europaeum]|uniref:C2H2-type domain-containing protein n=1 Tax=Trichoderma aggressivum f. europaeum TaxID=173218 RepID=A0AAE1M319_9HYPO|nr:hypothetical protein Triagg1_1413 [Trichoderma aggressivum f. europaeum]
MDSTELFKSGRKISSDFLQLVVLFQLRQSPKYRHLAAEEQRFQLWAHSLGLYQQGHASLDYRVRDAEIVRSGFARILEELQAHVENLLAIERNERLPYEAQEIPKDDRETEDNDSDRSDSERDNSPEASDLSSPSDDSSFHEIEFRLDGLGDAINALYSLADQIRSSLHRPQRNIHQLYKHMPAEKRDAEIQEREEIEIAAVCYLHRQYLIENTDKTVTAHDFEEIFAKYSSAEHWLLRRTGIANARRKQQFIYWKEHVIRLNQMRSELPERKLIPINPGTNEPVQNQLQLNLKLENTEQAALPIIPVSTTTATTLKPGDLRSVISHQTRVSTIISPGGKKLEWPDPPKVDVIGGYFICPYCQTLCPEKYLQKNVWIVHLIHDLQPYHCTYEQCLDPNQVYGSRQEWINHENGHTRVWHCHEHSEEFETQPEYIQHLEDSHPDSTPEHFSPALVAAAVGPSMQIYRDCPLCPSGFSDIAQMQSHLIFHLERLAQLALHNGPKALDDDTESGHSSQSHQGQLRGRKASIFRDFDAEEDESSFAELVANDETATVNNPSDIILNETTLGTVFGAISTPNVNEWLQNLVTEGSQEETNTAHEDLSSSHPPPKSHLKHFPLPEEYTIGWICSNSKTSSLAVAMLDERYAYPTAPLNSSYVYTKGSIGHHNIVITCPRIEDSIDDPTKKLNPNDLRKSFPSIQYCFIIGIGSGMSPMIQLGDVVLSTPPHHLQRVNSTQYTKHQPESWEHFPTSLLAALHKIELAGKDFSSGIIPRHIEEAKEKAPHLRSLLLSPPPEAQVHFGKTISETWFIDGATIRNELGTDYKTDMLCIEQKAAYFRTTVPYLVISGICGYADSHRNESWQDYATAVACAKGIVEYLPPQSIESDATPRRHSQVDPFRWLSAIDYSSQLDHNLRRYAPGTCQWFLESEQYREWYNQDGTALLLHGPPGSGKSMIASAVLDHLSNTLLSEQAAVFCYAFFNFYRGNEETAESLMCNLLKQLCQRQSPLPQNVEDLLARHRSQRTRPSLDEASSALGLLISTFPKTFIVVDGLDECKPSSASPLVSKIMALLVNTRAKFLATSRSLPDILKKFREHNSIIIEMPSSSAAENVGQYIKSYVKGLPGFMNHSPDALEQITNTIMKHSNGSFRIAWFLLESITDSETPESMMDTLEKQPSSHNALDAVGALMTRIKAQDAYRRDLAMNALLWMTFAFHPLRTKQLQHALAVEFGESSLDETNIPDADYVISVCEGLVVKDAETDTFRFCHESVNSWFTARGNELFPDACLYITRVFLTYLSFTAFESGIALSEDDLNRRFHQYPLYAFAACNWGYYALRVPECPDILLFLGKQANAAAAAQVIFLNGAGDQIAYVALPGVSVAIHLAAFFGLKEAVKVLLSVFDVDLKVYGGWTPLMVASMSEHLLMAELLLAEGADIEAKDDRGRTALSLAVFRAGESMVDFLITRGAKVNFHDNDGNTPLLTAIDHRDKALVQLLLTRGADVELKSTHGEAPVAYATKKEYGDITSLLLAARKKSSMGKSP